MTQPESTRWYFCPGEAHPVSRAVHLSRLAAHAPQCGECPLRHQAGHLPVPATRAVPFPPRPGQSSLLRESGFRGVYRNEFTRRDAGELTAAWIDWLAQDEARSDDAPRVVIGYQEHTAAPDLLVGVVHALRRRGAWIVDVGLTIPPALSLAVDHFQADGGILITNSGCGPESIGVDFLRSTGLPLDEADALRTIERNRADAPVGGRGGRGGYRTFLNREGYEAHVRGWFHALRPLRVCLATPSRMVLEIAESLFRDLPCELATLPLPQRRRDTTDPRDLDVVRLSERVVERGAHLGVLIDDDARGCAFLDERGDLVPIAGWLPLVADPTGAGHNSWPRVDTRGGVTLFEERPVRDAFRTLSRLLDALSRSDAEFSARRTACPSIAG